MRVLITTGGGDAPGLNAVIRAVTLAGTSLGWSIFGSRCGYTGLLDGDLVELNPDAVRGITYLGGTILGTTNKGDPFAWPFPRGDGEVELRDRSDELVAQFERYRFDALIAVGGDGSLSIAQRLGAKGIPVVGVPKTIDNDIGGTDETFGFDTAVAIATEAMGRLHSTAEAHERIMVCEVMGRYAGWIALYSGLGATADVCLIPEIPFEYEAICNKVAERELRGRHFTIVVIAEGAKEKGGALVAKASGEAGRSEPHLGGIGHQVAAELAERTGKDSRCVVLGHLQRGGTPSAYDRRLALRFGAAAVRLVAAKRFDSMVAYHGHDMIAVPLTAALEHKGVNLAGDVIQTARALGIVFGDEARAR